MQEIVENNFVSSPEVAELKKLNTINLQQNNEHHPMQRWVPSCTIWELGWNVEVSNKCRHLKHLMTMFRVYFARLHWSKWRWMHLSKCVNWINCLANKLLIKLIHTTINLPVVCRYSIVLSFFLFYFLFLFYLPYLSSIHEKANCIAILWTVSPHSLGSCRFRGSWVTCLPHKGGASR